MPVSDRTLGFGKKGRKIQTLLSKMEAAFHRAKTIRPEDLVTNYPMIKDMIPEDIPSSEDLLKMAGFEPGAKGPDDEDARWFYLEQIEYIIQQLVNGWYKKGKGQNKW